eukprot:COSAG01_NODE_2446_length_7684_cov_126.363564_17_plen_62_part_00
MQWTTSTHCQEHDLCTFIHGIHTLHMSHQPLHVCSLRWLWLAQKVIIESTTRSDTTGSYLF